MRKSSKESAGEGTGTCCHPHPRMRNLPALSKTAAQLPAGLWGPAGIGLAPDTEPWQLLLRLVGMAPGWGRAPLCSNQQPLGREMGSPGGAQVGMSQVGSPSWHRSSSAGGGLVPGPSSAGCCRWDLQQVSGAQLCRAGEQSRAWLAVLPL